MAFVTVVAGVTLLGSPAPAAAAVRFQVDPYTGGTVPPAQACPSPTLSVTPAAYAEANAPITLTTAAQRPNSPVSFYVNGALVASATTDGAGRASAAATAPSGMTSFDVAVSGVCGTVTVTLRSGGVASAAADNESVRGFARTGFGLLPWLLAAIACIMVGRKLLRESRRSGDRTRVKRARV